MYVDVRTLRNRFPAASSTFAWFHLVFTTRDQCWIKRDLTNDSYN